MLMALGQFVFQISDISYSELRRSTAWRHSANSRVGARPSLQPVGLGDDEITLTGVLVPEVAGQLSCLAMLRTMGDRCDAYAMVDGAGRVMGAWVIAHLEESGSAFTTEGVARRTEFSLQLKRAEDHQVSSAPPGDLVGTDDDGSRMRGYA